ncbi:MAG: NAD(+) diphosphatase [Aestuariivita sp.]|nr:NAD(+) diphosphatase [Aestuariivita sp.]
MILAETVTFGGGTLNRLAKVRDDKKAMSKFRTNSTARCLPLWRGKPLVRGNLRDELGLLPFSHSIFKIIKENDAATVFLGCDHIGSPVFATDLSSWSPDGFNHHAGEMFLDSTEQQHPDLTSDHVFIDLRNIMTNLSPNAAETAATAKALLDWHKTHRFCSNCGHESKITSAGWQRTCPACGSHHFPRTDPVVIMLVIHGNSVLLGRSHHWPSKMYSLLAGFIEPGETIEAAARREVSEETGIKIGSVDYLASQPWPFPTSMMIGCKCAALSTDIKIDPSEIDDAMWVNKDELVMVLTGQSTQIKPARKGAIAHFILKNWLSGKLDKIIDHTLSQ